MEITLSSEQQTALELLQSGDNIFLTGGAGSGKSFVIREFMKTMDPKNLPILASTGAAAVLLGGRTFHSFFGLGIMEGGPEATYARAQKDSKLLNRIKKGEGVGKSKKMAEQDAAHSAINTIQKELSESQK